MRLKQVHGLHARSIFFKVGVCVLFLFPLQTTPRRVIAQSDAQESQVRYRDGRVTLRTEDAELRDLLLELGEKTKIHVRVPVSLEKQITLNLEGVSPQRAFRLLLKDVNHAIVYSNTKCRTGIDRVFVFSRGKGASLSKRVMGGAAGRIKNVRRQLDALRDRLSRVGENSKQGKFFRRRIERLEKTMERLKR